MPKKQEQKRDVIIVGAGIAGCVLAFHLATAGLKVTIYEKSAKDNIGHDWCDSIEKKAFQLAGILAPKGEEKRANRDHLVILSPDLLSKIHLSYYDYWIVDRKLFQKRLLYCAEKAGAEFCFNTEIVEPVGKGMWVIGVKKLDGEIVTAKLVVDCSGIDRILGNNIEILDLNLTLEDNEIALAHRETHKIEDSKLKWGENEISKKHLYYRYGYEKGYSWVNFEKEDEVDVGSGVTQGYSKRKPKALVNEFINLHKNIEKEKLRGGGGQIVVRRPITMVWYGFLLVGEAACQTIPTVGCGVGSSMIAAKIAAEVIVKSIRKKEVSIDSLWEYQVRFTEKRGRDHAALDMMRRKLLQITEKEMSFLIEKRIISRSDFEMLIHAKYPKKSIIGMLFSAFKGISNLKLMIFMGKSFLQANRVYKHYKKFPKEYDAKKYHKWFLEQMYFFKEIEEKT
ncbi:MAG: NAD(P)/FAD-dependent oxidoreductase [Candidatus Heimdallarchaeota archaeon]|nr:NAD(P)/FAD-dependent oxidoreductase [Candidatus Heimdallarchaeota archaeon]